MNHRKHKLLAVLAAALLIAVLSVSAFAAGGSATITAEVKHKEIVIPVEPRTPQSPQTGDPGVMLYGVLSVSALLGMGWVAKKKR